MVRGGCFFYKWSWLNWLSPQGAGAGEPHTIHSLLPGVVGLMRVMILSGGKTLRTWGSGAVSLTKGTHCKEVSIFVHQEWKGKPLSEMPAVSQTHRTHRVPTNQ